MAFQVLVQAQFWRQICCCIRWKYQINQRLKLTRWRAWGWPPKRQSWSKRKASPSVWSNTLIRIIHKLSSLDLIEGSIRKVIRGYLPGHPIPPIQGEATLEKVPHDKHGDSQEKRTNPFHQHLVESVYILFAQGVEEITPQKIEQHTAGLLYFEMLTDDILLSWVCTHLCYEDITASFLVWITLSWYVK